MKVHALLCFGAAPGQGNLAQVIEDDGWDTEARQAFARASHANACVFVGAGVTRARFGDTAIAVGAAERAV